MPKYIIAIGGGEITNNDTISIDKTILALSENEKKHILFLPTASYDSISYAEAIVKYFGKFNCIVNTLFLTKNTYSDDYLKQAILETDIIYVGGGDTAYMMEIWRKYKIDQLLMQAYNKGVILSGLSAGAICWALSGHSDSQSFHSDKWSYSKVNGLGLIPTIICPHYNEKGRENFDIMLQQENSSGIALENKTALLKKDNLFKILKEDFSCKAYWLCCSINGNISKTEIGSTWFRLDGNNLVYL